MPIRRLNYTKRKKLTREQVRIRLSPSAHGGARTFDADLTMPPGLPGDARVFVEAYQASPAARMRFDFGTVDAMHPPPMEKRRLEDFNNDLPPLFRVKVTDARDQPGKLLADAHQIRPVDPDEKPDRRQGILYISWDDNDGLPWRLELDDDRGAILYIDETADPNHELPGRIEFRALVYPEIIRRVLTSILIEHEGQFIEDSESWHGRWVSFPHDGFGFTDPPPDPDEEDMEKQAWIDAAVRWCSRRAGFCAALAPREDEA